jgi:hypothetical protein
MSRQTFYQRWWSVAAVYAVAAGLGIMALALWPERLGLEAVTGWLFFPDPAVGGPVTGAARLATAVSGALTAGWGVMAWSLRPVLAGTAGAAQAGRAMAHGVVAWFVLDSAASVAVGAPGNVGGNVTLLAAMVPPALALAKGAQARASSEAGGGS